MPEIMLFSVFPPDGFGGLESNPIFCANFPPLAGNVSRGISSAEIEPLGTIIQLYCCEVAHRFPNAKLLFPHWELIGMARVKQKI